MFRSKGKQPPAPKRPWAIQILTTEYLIEGSLQPEEYQLEDRDIFWGVFHGLDYTIGTKSMRNKVLTDVRVQPTGSLTAPAQSFSKWLLTPATALVAIIPNDDASRQAARASCLDYKYPISSLVYAGPYAMRGTVLSDSPDRTSLLHEWSLLPLQEAEVDSQLPGGKLTSLRVPWLFLNSGLIHGIGVA